MNKESRFQKKIYSGLWILLALLSISALIKAYSAVSYMEPLSYGRVDMVNGKWEITEDAQGQLRYRYLIGEEEKGTLRFCMKTYLPEFQLFLDGKEIYSFSDRKGTEGRSLHTLRLPEGAQGKELMIQTKKTKDFMGKSKDLGKTYLGEESEVVIRLFWDNSYALLFGVIAALASLIMLCFSLFFRRRMQVNMFWAMINLSAFIFITGLWVVTDSEILLFLTSKISGGVYVSFLSFMIMPIFLLRFIDSLFGKRMKIKWLYGLFLVNGVLYVFNYIFEFVSQYLTLAPAHILCVCSIVIVMKNIFEIRKSGEKQEETEQLIHGFVFLAVFVLAALVLFYMNPVSPYAYLYCIGIAIFIFNLIKLAVFKFYEQLEENASSAAYRRLAYTDVMTGLGNRTAFIEEHAKERFGKGTAYILFDVNNLKMINDQYGHQMGDLAIVTADRYIREFFGSKGRCFRIGGDEFVVILKESHDDEIKINLERFRNRMENENRNRNIDINIAAGYAVMSGDGETEEQLFRRADANMYEEKKKMKKN